MDLGDFTVFNLFLKSEFVYMILSINNRELNDTEITINIDGETLKFNSKHVKNGPSEPILIFIYDKPTIVIGNNVIATITYNNISKCMEIENINLDKHYVLTITTLFKDDYKIFPLFYEYYKTQGVEHFYMYYNGILTNEIRELFNKEDVTLIEWNFKYWLQGCRYTHHAQLGQMHDALYKYGKSNSKYMIFCDLDEYMNIPNNSLNQFILEHPEIDTFGFCNIWSKTVDNKVPDRFPYKFMIGDRMNYGSRSKNIYKIDEKNVVGIHSAMCLRDKKWTPGDKFIINLDMYHFYNWSQPNRIEKVNHLYETK